MRIGGQEVLTDTDVRDSGGSVAGWIDGRDVVLVFAVKGLSANSLATNYLTGSRFRDPR